MLNDGYVRSLGLNDGFLDRAHLIRAFVGRGVESRDRVMARDANCADAQWITETDLIALAKIRHIDFLKCDIEGGEFGLLGRDSQLLAMTKVLACEVHAFAGDVAAFMSNITASGFTLGPIERELDGSVTFVAKRCQ
jgi:hypothetical protein